VGRGRTRIFRFALVVVLAAALATVVATVAHGLAFDDSAPCPVGAEQVYTCPGGTVDMQYSVQIVSRGGCGPALPYQYRILNGALPSGISLSTSGLLSGRPTTAGNYRFWVELSDENPPSASWCRPETAEREFSIAVGSRVLVTTESAAPGTVGTAYSQSLTGVMKSGPDATSPPSSPLAWSVVAGALPPGIALNSSTGALGGTPTAEGSYAFTVKAALVDGRSDTKALTIAVRAPLKITGTGLFGGAGTPIGGGELVRTEVGVPFLATLEVSGGSGEYTWAIAQGTLPPGVTMANGNFLGRPTEAGIYRVTISAADTEGRTATFPAVVTVAERLAVATQRMKPGKVGRTYRAKLVATGGVLPKKWKKAGGKLPKGLRLDRKLGVVKGKPMKAGRYRVVFEVSDALGVKSKRAFRITIAPAPKKRG
jgi:hypothetical protein